jgi:hypothetical protein
VGVITISMPQAGRPPHVGFSSAYFKLLAMALSIRTSSAVGWIVVCTSQLKKNSVAIISSNMQIIQEVVHWVPLSHDMHQNLEK